MLNMYILPKMFENQLVLKTEYVLSDRGTALLKRSRNEGASAASEGRGVTGREVAGRIRVQGN